MTLENTSDELEHVVVTGANGHLGSVVTDTFLEAGCTVAGLDLSVDERRLTVDDEHDRLYWRHLDATDSEEVQAAMTDIEETVGRIDALINCAGGFRWTPIDEAGDEDVEFLLEANLQSAMYMVREVVDGMKNRGFGRIVLISSQSTLNPSAGEGPYAGTKAGVNALTQSVAEEVRGEDVTINAILPSVIDTPPNREDMPDEDFSKWVEREQLAEIIFRLTQAFGDPINGALIPVAGDM